MTVQGALLVIVFGFHAIVSVAAAEPAGSMPPVLPLDAATTVVPLMDQALRDPTFDLRAGSSKEAEQFLKKAKAFEAKIKTAKKGKKEKILNESFRYYLAVAYYLEDVQDGRIKDKKVGELAAIRTKVKKYAKQLAAITNDSGDKQQATYHSLVSTYLNGKPDEAFRELLGAERADLGRLGANLELLTAEAELSQSNQAQGRVRLEQLLPKVSGSAAIVANLLLARSLGGVDSNAQVYQEADPQYRTYITEATKRSAVLSASQRQKVFTYAFGIWKLAEDGKEDWEKSPIHLEAFKDLPFYVGVEERLALQSLEKGKTAEAMQRYAKIIETLKQQPVLGALYGRLLDIGKVLSDQAKDPKPYAEVLRSINIAFKNKNVLGTKQQAVAGSFAKKFRERYRSVVTEILDQARSPQSTPELRASALQIANGFLPYASGKEERIVLKSGIAGIYVANGDHANAVVVYDELKNQTEGADARKYLRALIDSQSVLAKWPASPPWDKVPPGEKKHRLSLADMYAELNQHTRSMDWGVMAHLGLLNISLNDKTGAFTLWLKALQKDPNSEHAANAAGVMLSSYAAAKQWPELVSAVRIVKKMKVTPTVSGQNLNADTYLADGLFQGGYAAYEKGFLKPGALFLEEFTLTFPNDKRYVDAVYQKGLAYMKLKDAKFAQAMREIVMEHSSSKYLRDAILNGMKGSTVADDKIFFSEAYLKNFPKAVDFQAVREKLANVYLENKNYGQAGRIYEQQSKDPAVSKDGKIASALKQLKIEDEFGDSNKARAVADNILVIGKGNDSATAKAIAFMVRFANKQKNVGAYEGYEKTLLKMNATNQDVMEALAQTRYFIAEREAAKPLAEIDSRTLKDPVKEIQNQLTIYQNLRTSYEKVCAVGRTQYCEMSKAGLSQMTLRSIRNIDSIVLPSALDEGTVQAFETNKVKIKMILSQTVIKTKASAMGH